MNKLIAVRGIVLAAATVLTSVAFTSVASAEDTKMPA